MPKFFIQDNQIQQEEITIIGEDVNHIKNVLRYQKGDEIYLCNPEKGNNYLGIVQEITKDKIICNSLKKIPSTAEPNTYIHLFQALPKAEKMEWIIQKCIEVGVGEITPVIMSRCVVKLDEKADKKKNIRWQKIAEVASKQCNRDRIPKVNSSIKISNLNEKIKDYDLILVAYEKEEENTLKNEIRKLNTNPQKIAILVGPEGGFEEQEIEYLKSFGSRMVTLGTRILRTETAPIVFISNILYELEN